LVGKQNAYEHIRKLYDRVADNERVTSLKVEPVLNSAKAAFDTVVELEASVFSWSGDEWVSKKEESERLITVFKKKFELMLDYGRSIRNISTVALNKEQSTNRNDRRKKNAQAVKMIECGVPETVADFFADNLQPRKEDRSSFSFNSAGSIKGVDDEYQGFENGHVLTKPYCFFQFNEHGADQPTFLHQQIARLCDILGPPSFQKLERSIEYFSQNSKATALLMTTGSFMFVFNEPEKPVNFTMPGNFTPYMVIGKAWHVSFKIELRPTAGLAHFIIVSHGYGLVLLVPIALVIDSGYTVDSLSDFLNACDPAVIEKQHAYGVEPGHGVFCPFGHVAVVVGVGPSNLNSKDQKERYEHLQYYVVPALDTASFLNAPKAVQVEVSTWLEKACTRNLSVLNVEPNNDLLPKWLKSLKAASPKVSAADAVSCETVSKKSLALFSTVPNPQGG